MVPTRRPAASLRRLVKFLGPTWGPPTAARVSPGGRRPQAPASSDPHRGGKRRRSPGDSGSPARSAVGIDQRIIDLSGEPQMVEQHRQLAGYSYRCAFLGVLAATLAQAQAKALQVAVRSERPQNVLAGLDPISG